MDENEKKDSEFKVVDKRRFHEEDGEIKTSQDDKDRKEDVSAKKEEEKKVQEQKNEAKKEASDKGDQPKNAPQIDFITFVLSLVSSTQVHLGLIENPVTNKRETDMTAARQTIDILSILKEKTKGNLSNDEERLLEYVLYDLRMKYVELNKK